MNRLIENAKDELEWDMVRLHLDRMTARGQSRLESGARAAAGKPRELHLELTHRCNLKCVMCEHWEIEHVDPASVKREMDLPAIRELASGGELLSEIATVVITGGEPWLRTDFTDIVAFLSERFPRADIIVLSNFWNTGHIRLKLEELKSRKVTRLRLGSSLDGLEAAHDRIRGQGGSFRGIVNTVKMLREEFSEIPFGFTFTITPHNAGELMKTFQFVTGEFGCSLGAQWAIDRPGVAALPWTPETVDLGLAQIHAVLLSLVRAHDAARKIVARQRLENAWLWSELLYWRNLEEYGRNPRRFPFFKKCLAGERHVMLDPEGNVFFCPVNRDKTIGNARQESLESLWKSPRAGELRDYVESCSCHCWLRCMGAPVLDRLVRLSA